MNPSNSTISSQTCAGSFAQQTVTLENTIGPLNICIGPERSVGCLVPSGYVNLNVHTDTLLASAIAVPTLSLWALGALAVALGALGLRRLATRAG